MTNAVTAYATRCSLHADALALGSWKCRQLTGSAAKLALAAVELGVK